MKKMYVMLVLLMATSFVFAQVRQVGENVKMMDSKQVNLPSAESKAPTDTLVPYGIANATNLMMFPADNGGYVAGVNGFGDQAVAQHFPVTPAEGYIVEGFLAWVGAKEIVGNAGTVDGVIYDMTGSGTTTDGTGAAPGVVLESVTLDMDTDVDTVGFTVVMFNNPVLRSHDYAIGMDFTNMGNDTLGIVHSNDGDADDNERSWSQWDDGDWYSFLTMDNWGLDIDLALLPVVDMSTVDINEQAFINGVRMEVYPNPAVDVLNIDFHIREAAEVNINIMDMTGRTVQTQSLGNKEAGEYSTSLSVDQLSTGVYLYMIEAGNQRLVKRVNVQ